MLGYVCKYTPMELFEAMDTEIHTSGTIRYGF